MDSKCCDNCGNWEYECICSVIAEVESIITQNKELKAKVKELEKVAEMYKMATEITLKLTKESVERGLADVKAGRIKEIKEL